MTYIRNSSANTSDAAQLLYGKTSQSGISKTASASAVLETAEKRIRGEVDRTTTLLSSLGKLKSSIADAQGAARTLSGFSATTTDEQMKTGIKQLVTAFNAAATSSKNISTTSGGTTEAPGATRVGQEWKRTINSDVTLSDTLRKWGVSVNSNGQLAFDETKFDARQKTDDIDLAAFQKLGQVVDKVSTKALAEDGIVGRSMTSLNKRADTLKAQQTTLIKALQADTSSQAESKTQSGTSEETAKTQQKSLFDVLDTETDEKTETSTPTRNAALAAYLAVSKG